MKITVKNLLRLAGVYRSTYRLNYCNTGEAECGSGNWGDMLSPYIVAMITGKTIKTTDINDPYKIIALGSLINNYSIRMGGIFWGTGIGESSVNFVSPRFPLSFRAVRGPVTRNSLLQAGYECPAVFGDPALLLPKFYNPKQTKKYRLGFIPHLRHAKILVCAEEVKMINLLRKSGEVTQAIDEICECDAILSTSLHGIIVANAYGIPAAYAIVRGYPLEGKEGMKFSDYFQSVSMPDQQPLVLDADSTITEKYYDLITKTVDLKIDLNLLLDSFPHDLNFR